MNKIENAILRSILGLFFASDGFNSLFHFYPDWRFPPPVQALFNDFSALGLPYVVMKLILGFSGLMVLSNNWAPLGIFIIWPNLLFVFLLSLLYYTPGLIFLGPLFIAETALLWDYRHIYATILKRKPEA